MYVHWQRYVSKVEAVSLPTPGQLGNRDCHGGCERKFHESLACLRVKKGNHKERRERRAATGVGGSGVAAAAAASLPAGEAGGRRRGAERAGLFPACRCSASGE